MKSTLENCIPGLNIKVPGELDFYENVFFKKILSTDDETTTPPTFP